MDEGGDTDHVPSLADTFGPPPPEVKMTKAEEAEAKKVHPTLITNYIHGSLVTTMAR